MTTHHAAFLTQFRGSFISLMTWEQLSAFWQTVRADADKGWYLYVVGDAVPTQPRNGPEVHKFIDEIDALLRREHDEDYCGIVYADSKSEPTFIKIFDPHNLGVACGSSKNPPLPGWIMSLAAPVALDSTRILPEQRKRWWQQLWAAPLANLRHTER